MCGHMQYAICQRIAVLTWRSDSKYVALPFTVMISCLKRRLTSLFPPRLGKGLRGEGILLEVVVMFVTRPVPQSPPTEPNVIREPIGLDSLDLPFYGKYLGRQHSYRPM